MISPPHIPDHQLLRCIAVGSYGEVWLGRNVMGTYRAIKIVRRDRFDSERPYEREYGGIKRFEPISRSKEGFIDILQIGRNDRENYFYYVMELGDDLHGGQPNNPDTYLPKTLAAVIRQWGKLPPAKCLNLALLLTQALSHLHQHGLVHRDIKPSNILFVEGQPKLADIGLVTGAGEACSLVGTDGFIPPDGIGSPSADLYALGKVIYEASTGKDRHDFPELPGGLLDAPERDQFLELNEVVLKACQNDVRQRYATAEAMYADLVVLLNGKSVKRLRLLERRMRKLKRLAIPIALALWFLGTLAYQIDRVHALTMQSRQRQAGADVARGTLALNDGLLSEALPWFVQTLDLDQSINGPVPSDRLRIAAALAQCPKLVQMWSLPLRVNAVAFSPDGRWILGAEWTGKARVWDAATGKPVSPPFGQRYQLVAAAFSPDGSRVVTASEDRTACLWNALTGRKLLTLQHPDALYNARFSPDGREIVTACSDGKVRVWNARDGTLINTLSGHAGAVRCASFSPDGARIVSASQDDTARIWRAATGKTIAVLRGNQSWVYDAAFSPDGRFVVTAGADRTARVWNAKTGAQLFPAMRHHDLVLSAEFSPDGRYILTGCADGTAHLWDARTLQPLPENSCLLQSSRVTDASFAPDGHRVVTACSDGTIRIWDLAGNDLWPRPVTDTYSPDGSRYLRVQGNSLSVRDAASGKPLSGPIHLPTPLRSAQFSGNGHYLLTITSTAANHGHTNYQAIVWDTASGQRRGVGIPLPPDFIQCHLDNDGRLLGACSTNALILYSVSTGRATVLQRDLSPQPTGLQFSPNGKLLEMTAGNRVSFWDVDSGRPLPHHLELPTDPTSAEFSPDSRRFVTACSDTSFKPFAAQVWNVFSGEAVGKPLAHRDGVGDAAFSPHGRRVVTASEDFTAVIWDAITGQALTPPLVHRNQVKSAAFSPNGRWVVTASFDKTARIWDAGSGDPLTPPFIHPHPLRHARFVDGDHEILTTDRDGHSSLWILPHSHKPLKDLLAFAEILTGRAVAAPDVAKATPLHNLLKTWKMLKAKYPEDFTVSKGELVRWHIRQARLSEAAGQWSAAIFHYNRLIALQPNNHNWVIRRAHARNQVSRLTLGQTR